MILGNNCDKLSKFVQVAAKILSVLFSGHCVHVLDFQLLCFSLYLVSLSSNIQ